MITRKQYINEEATHKEYYGQFAPSLVRLVGDVIGREKIQASTDEYFNDIPLKRWDALQGSVMAICGAAIAEASGGGVSLSDCVSAAKAAARLIREDT